MQNLLEKALNQSQMRKMQLFDGDLPTINESPEQLQRTSEWFEKRKGRFTGSGIAELMKTTIASKKYQWGQAEKLVDFSDTAIKYIYEKAKERQRNKVVKIVASAAMKYGTANEIVVKELLKKQGYEIQDCDFIEIKGLEGIAGASPDGIAINMQTGEIFNLEIKCATDWNNVFDRHEEDFDEKQKDFWQIQTEMLVTEQKSTLYVVAEPSENIFEPNITDLSIKIVPASPIHQKCIIQRCLIGQKAIEYFLNGMNIKSAVIKAATEFKF